MFGFGELRIVVSHDLPREHYATEVNFLADHPLYAWWQRKVWHRRGYSGLMTFRGREITRCAGKGFRLPDGTFVVSPEMNEALKKHARAA